MKKVVLIVFVLTVFAFSNSKAQGFEKNSFIAGASFGTSYGFIWGLNLDYGVTDKISAGVEFCNSKYAPLSFNYTLMGFLATGSYHFMPQEKIDPFVKVELGFFGWSNEMPAGYLSAAEHKSGLGWGIQGGCRYFFTDNIAGRVMLGFPYYFGAGIDFKIQ